MEHVIRKYYAHSLDVNLKPCCRGDPGVVYWNAFVEQVNRWATRLDQSHDPDVRIVIESMLKAAKIKVHKRERR